MKIKKISVLLLTLMISACSSGISQLTDNPVSKEQSEILSPQEISAFDKEYLPFSTKVLTESYLKRKILTWLGSPAKEQQLLKEVAYARFKHKETFCNVLNSVPNLLDQISVVGSVSDRMAIDAPFRDFIENGCALIPANVILVNDDAPGPVHDGTSWAKAYVSLQDAISASSADTKNEIWVADGTYNPTERTAPDDPRSATFQLKAGVVIYGGFTGTNETQLNQRDFNTNKVILSGDLSGDDVENDLTAIHKDDNVYHVVTGATATLDGVSIKYGYANGSGNNANGGGFYIAVAAAPTINNVTLSNNFASTLAGGMYNSGSSTILTNVTFDHNSSSSGGGLVTASIIMNNVTFSNNSSSGLGGGVRITVSGLGTFNNLTFYNNSAVAGGGVYNQAPITLTNATFDHNSASSQGGGLYTGGPINLTNISFSNNSASTGGGMFFIGNTSTPITLTNTSFSKNSATTAGGGLEVFGSQPLVATIKNSIFWGNTAPSGKNIFTTGSNKIINIGYTDVEEGLAGIIGGTKKDMTGTTTITDDTGFAAAGNINADPLFTSATDLSLQSGSPCIDTGTTIGAPATDITGKARDASPDMGAYEADEPPSGPPECIPGQDPQCTP
jgi:predicted outer membrane repeat protein